MSKPTYEELESEVKRLRSKLSFGEDELFTEEVRKNMPPASRLESYLRKGKYSVRPAEMWGILFGTEASTRELASLGRSLQALGWARSARLGNVVFTISVDEYGQ